MCIYWSCFILKASNLHASGLSQMVCLALLKHWTLDGFLKHCATVADFYRARGDRMLQAVNKHLKSHVEYHPPSAGLSEYSNSMHITIHRNVFVDAFKGRGGF